MPDPSYATPGLVRWRRATDGALLVLAIGSLPFLLLEFARDELPRSDRVMLDVVNVIVLVGFALDYVVELALASNRRAFVRHEWTSLVIVVAQALALLPALAGLGVLRVLRGARAFRAIAVVFRVIAIGGATAREGREVIRRRAASFALTLAALTWLTSAAAFTVVEDVGEGKQIDSFGDALWWSTTTITTVGYGDIFPVTAVGRMIAAVTMIVGISAFAVVTAKVAEFLVRADVEALTEEVEALAEVPAMTRTTGPE
jgi:voltage-gated potassium channel